ncbi:alpha/beta fold hydrolase [Streptomyces albulus]|nr:alpha/beta fold hydrolase [Streptomyces noursei]
MTPPAAPALHHTVNGPLGAPPLVLGPSLGTALSLWDPQLPDLAHRFRVVRWDLPGHGGTSLDALADPGTTTVPELAGLVLDLADTLGLDRFAYAGASLGGAVGAWLAAHHPYRIASLALVCSSARFGEPAGWRDRAAQVRAEGPTPSPTRPPAAGSPRLRRLTDRHRPGRGAPPGRLARRVRGLLRRAGRLRPAQRTAPDHRPTLVVAGRADPATRPRTPANSPTASGTPASSSCPARPTWPASSVPPRSWPRSSPTSPRSTSRRSTPPREPR